MVNLEIQNYLNTDRSIEEDLSPRDLLFLKNLTRYNLTLIEIKVSPICPLIGKNLSDIQFPENAMVINIIQNERNYFPKEDFVLQSSDIVYFLADKAFENKLRKLFIPHEYV
jgi:Trk K+ transport system NAD-binding subunit